MVKNMLRGSDMMCLHDFKTLTGMSLVCCIQDILSSRAALGRVHRASKGILHTSISLALLLLNPLMVSDNSVAVHLSINILLLILLLK